MQSRSRLRAIAAAALAAAVVGVAPGAASATWETFPDYDQRCERAPSVLRGIGASLQREAQRRWGADIVSPALSAFGGGFESYGECSFYDPDGSNSIVYEASGSGSGLREFGMREVERDAGFAYAATDDPPSAAQLATGRENHTGETGDDSEINVIPVAQAAIAVPVQLPDGCSLAPEDRKVSAVRLEAAFRNEEATTWGEIVEGLAGGGCDTDKTFTRVVRRDTSGTTLQFKRYLVNVAGAPGVEREDEWTGVSDADPDWPQRGQNLVEGAANGAGSQLAKLSEAGLEDDGGIAYADLASARAADYGWNLTFDRFIWLHVEQTPEGQPAGNGVFRSPAVDDDLTADNPGANCGGVTYADIDPPFGLDPNEDWGNVTAVTTEEDYPICTLTYLLTYSNYEDTGVEQGAARAVFDYATYIVNGGQERLAVSDYAPLPAAVQTIARGVASDTLW